MINSNILCNIFPSLVYVDYNTIVAECILTTQFSLPFQGTIIILTILLCITVDREIFIVKNFLLTTFPDEN